MGTNSHVCCCFCISQLRKKALERRELDSNFEHKKFNLSIDDNPECNKENTLDSERPGSKKYYEKLE